MTAERVQKLLARAGVGSRRAVEDLIASGRVKVNGRVVVLGAKADPSIDRVEIDGSPVPLDQALVYYLFNKPEGVVTTASDPDGRVTVMDLVETPARVWPVGRLDIDSEGALILTNDGELTLRLTHPRFGVAKTYVAQVHGEVGRRALKALRTGVQLADGPARARSARVLESKGGRSLVELSLAEGRHREVRRMLEALGYPVTRLVRTAIGPLMLNRLKPGTLRRLTEEEVRTLYRAGSS